MINLPTLADLVAAIRALLQARPLADFANLHERTHAAGSITDIDDITAARPFIAITYDGTTSQPAGSLSQPQQLSADTFTCHIIGSRAAKDAEATGGNLANDLMKIRNHLIQLLIAKKLLPRYFGTQTAATAAPAPIGTDGLGLAVSFNFPFYFCPEDGYDLTEIDLQRIIVQGTPANPQNHPIIPESSEVVDIAAYQQGDYGVANKAMLYRLDDNLIYLIANNTALTGNTPQAELPGNFQLRRSGGGLPTITAATGAMRILADEFPPAWTILHEWNNDPSIATSGNANYNALTQLQINATDRDGNAVNNPSFTGGGYYRIERIPQSESAPPAAQTEGALTTPLGIAVGGIPAMQAAFSPTDSRSNVRWRLSRRTSIANAVAILMNTPPLTPLTNPFTDNSAIIWTIQRTFKPQQPAVEIPQADINLT